MHFIDYQILQTKQANHCRVYVSLKIDNMLCLTVLGSKNVTCWAQLGAPLLGGGGVGDQERNQADCDANVVNL
jgi:hypothetical protein